MSQDIPDQNPNQESNGHHSGTEHFSVIALPDGDHTNNRGEAIYEPEERQCKNMNDKRAYYGNQGNNDAQPGECLREKSERDSHNADQFFVNMKLEQNNNTSENAEPEQNGLSVFLKEGLFII